MTPEAGTWDNFTTGAGRYAMRSLAEVGRAVDMAGAVFPIAVDAVTGGTERQDQYFKEHNEVFNRAVDYWTPAPGEVGTAGQIAGQLAGGIMQAVISPALLVGTAQLSTAEELTRQGVDPGAALVVGDIAGIGTAAGIKLPFLGKTLASRVLTGAAGNVAQGAAMAGASRAVLDAAGNPLQAAQYDPLDLKARLLDAMLGAAFGGLAHLDATKVAAKLTATDEAALLVANQARHLEDTTLAGRPVSDADLTAHVSAMRQAVDQVLRGELVQVDSITRGMQIKPDDAMLRQRTEVADELARLVKQETPEGAKIEPLPAKGEALGASPAEAPPIVARAAQAVQRAIGEVFGVKMADTEAPASADPAISKARQAVADRPDMLIPTGDVAPDGTPVHVRAADAIAQADAALAQTRTTAPGIFRTAAACLLGVL
ncbi:MAG: hypothetical protein HZB40_16720 [Rhodocyclales bacterium]|nr:hypothetical protein [Rhodocyclales bacterium]